VVFTGRHVAEYLANDTLAIRSRGNDEDHEALRVLCSSSLDRVATDLQRLGLTRSTRTATSEQWLVDDRVSLEITHVAGDESDPGMIWLEYASLLTMAAKVGERGKRLTVRITGAPALLALDWATYRASGESPLDSAELEDIIVLAAGRAELAQEVSAAPTELKAFVAEETRRFLTYDGAEHVIHGALPGANRPAAMVIRVLERLRSIAG
jgi:hypothetical protein